MDGSLEKTYSAALFQLAVEENSLGRIYEELIFLSEVFQNNPELIKGLSSPALSAEEKQGVISEIFEGKLSLMSYNFLSVLIEKGRIAYIDKIAAEFKQMYYDKNGILEITVTTALPLSEELRIKLKEKLEKISSKKIILKEKLDTSILGGIILDYGNTKLDVSVKSKIDAMRSQINSIIA